MTPPDSATRRFLRQVRLYVAQGRSRISDYATERAYEELGWDEDDILTAVIALGAGDLLRQAPIVGSARTRRLTRPRQGLPPNRGAVPVSPGW